MFERFTERARQVVVLAQDEARTLRHNYIGTEHLLLGLLREEEGLAARTLASLGVTLEQVSDGVRTIVGEGEAGTPATGQIPFTPRAKETLELALREAQALGHKYIGTEHVLLGVVRLNEGVAVQILESLGVAAAAVHDQVIRMLGGQRPGRASTVSMMSSPSPSPSPSLRPARGRRASSPVELLVAGWLLFGGALGIGVLVGWAIWG
jgi:ATP-dependent Clp protease ATP-binding subunit ClpC